jgi:hypothetical protein
MPKPRDPKRKKPPRVALRKEIAVVAEKYADKESKDLSEVVHDALRYYFANAFAPPLWPPADKGNDA